MQYKEQRFEIWTRILFAPIKELLRTEMGDKRIIEDRNGRALYKLHLAA